MYTNWYYPKMSKSKKMNILSEVFKQNYKYIKSEKNVLGKITKNLSGA